MNLKEALEEIRTEYRDDAVVITSDRDKALGDFADETDDEQEVWLEWGEVHSGDVTVPATPTAWWTTSGGSNVRTCASQTASSSPRGGSEARNRSVSRTLPASVLSVDSIPSGPATTSSVEPPPTSTTSVRALNRPSLATPASMSSASSSPLTRRLVKP